MLASHKITGLVAAPFTPFHPNGSLNLDMIEKQALALSKAGVRGAFVCGTTGEGLSLTVAERKHVAERWVAVAPKQLSVLVHVGHNCLADAQELAGHAQRIGAHSVSTVAPSFFKPASASDLVDFFATVASAAPELPFYYYHMPGMTGVSFPAFEVMRLAAERIPTFAGIKFTHEDIMDYQRSLEFAGGRFDVLFGRDEILLSALAVGARGAVGSTYNYAAEVYHRVIAAFEKGDLDTARAEQARAVVMIEALIRFGGGVIAGKAIMRMIGFDCGPVRPPLKSLSGEQCAALEAELKRAGILTT
jgi:N-acetylneuraminate lyase